MARIFVIDDSKFMRNLIKNILIEGGHIISGEASNGQEALMDFPESSSDLLIVDLNLPDINGIEVIRKLRKKNPDVKAIIFSSISHNNYKMESYTAGESDYLVTPFDFDKLLDAISRVLEREK